MLPCLISFFIFNTRLVLVYSDVLVSVACPSHFFDHVISKGLGGLFYFKDYFITLKACVYVCVCRNVYMNAGTLGG